MYKTIFVFLFALLSLHCSDRPPKEAIELNNKACGLRREGLIDSAIVLLDEAIKKDSSYFLAYSNKCTFLWELNRNDSAFVTAKACYAHTNDKALVIMGIAFEKVHLLDSAKTYYREIIKKAGNIKNLGYKEKADLAIFVTIVYGKEKGLPLILEALKEPGLSEVLKETYKMFRNEIQYYKGGGMLESMTNEQKEYCLKSGKDIDDLYNYLLNNGVNAGLSGSDGEYKVIIKDKFKERAFELGVTDCKE